MQGVNLVQDGLPVLEVGLLLGGIDEGELRGNAVRMVWVLSAALGFAPGVFGVVEVAQAEVFSGGPGVCWLGGLLGGAYSGSQKQKSCQRESCIGHPAILRTRRGSAKSGARSVMLIPAYASEYVKEFLCVLA